MTVNKRYDIALETRKFEIELFWKRSLFFWGFIAAAFVAFAAFSGEKEYNIQLRLIVALFGFICSLCWTLANRGSKYWQENWEQRVELIEDKITGTLFKESLPIQKKIWWLRARKFSVSKLAISLSDYVTIVWFSTSIYSVSKLSIFHNCNLLSWNSDALLLAFFFFSLAWAAVTVWFARTSSPPKKESQEMLQDFQKRRRRFFWLALVVLLVIGGLAHVFLFPQRDIYDRVIFDLACLGLAGIVLALISICFDYPKLQENISEVGEKIGEASTAPISVFPTHLNKIEEMVNKAKRSLCIMADCIDYGSFFNPDGHDKVIDAIEKALNRPEALTVKILIPGKPQPISRSSRFYGPKFEERGDDKEFQEILERYVSHNKYPRPNTDLEFNTMLQKKQEEVRKKLAGAGAHGAHIYGLDGEEIKEITVDVQNQGPDFFFWIADSDESGENALFLFSENINGIAPKTDASPNNRSDAQAFHTQDPRLIKVFKRILAQYPPKT